MTETGQTRISLFIIFNVQEISNKSLKEIWLVVAFLRTLNMLDIKHIFVEGVFFLACITCVVSYCDSTLQRQVSYTFSKMKISHFKGCSIVIQFMSDMRIWAWWYILLKKIIIISNYEIFYHLSNFHLSGFHLVGISLRI